MFPSFISEKAQQLTETTSINLTKKIKSEPISTPLHVEPILTSYVKQGKSDIPLLLLHGFDSSLLEFRRLMPLIPENREVWAIDLLGAGFCERKLDLKYNPETIKTHLYYVWKTLIQKPVILVGASMGGATAIDLTLTYPDMVNKLVLIDSVGLTKQPVMGKLMFPPLDYFATQFLRNLKVRQAISEKAYYDKSFAHQDALICAALHLDCPYWNKSLISFTKSGGYGYYGDRLDSIKQETLIIWGEDDKILGIKPAEKFQQTIPNSELKWIPQCGHVPHLEKAKITSDYILEFATTC